MRIIIDTVVLESPSIPEKLAILVEQNLIKRTAVDLKSGELIYEFTNKSLDGSFDNRISLQVNRHKWKRFKNSKIPEKIMCQPYLRIECSVHKQMLGHNVYGGSDDLEICCYFLIELLEELLGLPEGILPLYQNWIVLKVDYTKVFLFENITDIDKIFRAIRSVYFPRRQKKVMWFGEHSCLFPGTTTTVKLYHKGREFKENKGLKKYMRIKGQAEAFKLLSLANHIIRCEVSIKKRKLVSDFKDYFKNLNVKFVMTYMLNTEYLEGVYNVEVDRLFSLNKSELEMVSTHEKVYQRLSETYKSSKANLLFGMWLKLATMGESTVRQELPPTTYYRQTGELKKAGVVWSNTNVVVDDNMTTGFVPLTNNVHVFDLKEEKIKQIERTYKKKINERFKEGISEPELIDIVM